MNEAALNVSVLFVDVSGSARLHEKLGSGEALRAVDRCMKRMERTVDVFNGRIVKIVGDELMATFMHADEALQAAVEMQQRVADLPPVSGVKLEIRVGFAHGAVVEENATPSGETVSRAASLAGLARPGQILTDQGTQEELPAALRKTTREFDAPPGGSRSLQTLVEVFLTEGGGSLGSGAKSVASEPVARQLRLIYRDKSVVIDSLHPVISLGRDQDCDVQIFDRRASRRHATIEWLDERPVLIDRSTNGTFVTLGDEPEVFLRRRAIPLYGSGMIGFATTVSSPDVDADRDCARFEQIV